MPIDVTQATLDFYKSHPKAMKAGLTDDDIMARHAKLPGMQQWNIENTARRVKQAEDVQRQISEQADHVQLPPEQGFTGRNFVRGVPDGVAVGYHGSASAENISDAIETRRQKQAEEDAAKALMKADKPLTIEEKFEIPGYTPRVDGGEVVNELSGNRERLSPFGPGKSRNSPFTFRQIQGDPSNALWQRGEWNPGVSGIVKNIQESKDSELLKYKQLLALSGQVRDVLSAQTGSEELASDLTSLKMQEWQGNITNEEMKAKAKEIAENYRQRQMKLLDSSSIWDTDGPRTSIGASQD